MRSNLRTVNSSIRTVSEVHGRANCTVRQPLSTFRRWVSRSVQDSTDRNYSLTVTVRVYWTTFFKYAFCAYSYPHNCYSDTDYVIPFYSFFSGPYTITGLLLLRKIHFYQLQWAGTCKLLTPFSQNTCNLSWTFIEKKTVLLESTAQ